MKTQKQKSILKNQNGFSMVDMILAIAVMGLIVTFVAEFFLSQSNSYMLVANRQEAIGDVRFALNKIHYELLRVDPTTEITTYDATEILFIDSSGAVNSFSLNTVSTGGLGIYMGTDLLMSGVDNFTMTYYDSSGNELNPFSDPANDIARIKVNISAIEHNNEGNVTLQTSVTPRSVIGYDNFQ